MPDRVEGCQQEMEPLTPPVEESAYLAFGDMSFLMPLEEVAVDDLTGIALPDADDSLVDAPRLAGGGLDEPQDEEAALDLSPGAADKTNDPVRIYMREMAAVPLLTR